MAVFLHKRLRWGPDRLFKAWMMDLKLSNDPTIVTLVGDATDCGSWAIHEEKHGKFCLTHAPTGRLLKTSKSKRALKELAQRLTDTGTDWTQTDYSYYQQSEIVVGLRDFLKAEHITLDVKGTG